MPTPYTMKFIIIVWLAFLARQSPVSTIANPACMNMTMKPQINVHMKLMPILFWPTWLTKSLMVRPFLASETATSATVPVRPPSGSPLARASAFGASTPFKSASVIGTGAGAGAAAGAGVAGAGAGTGPH